MIYLQLFFEFFKTGLFSIGGGLATVPFLADMASRTGWFTFSELTDMIAIAESTPGPIGVNAATYVGYTAAIGTTGSQFLGILGAVTATLALTAPSVIIILIIAKLLTKYKENFYVNAGFYGLRPASLALITSAGLTMAKVSFFNEGVAFSVTNILQFCDFKSILLAIFVFLVIRKTKLHVICYIAFSALIGIIFNFAV